MEIYNKEEHIACYCYDRNEKPMIEVIKIGYGETGKRTIIPNEIVFIMQGRIRFSLSDNLSEEFHKGQIVFLPAGDNLLYKASEYSIILIFRLYENVQLCNAYSLERLHEKIKVSIVQKPKILTPLAINVRLEYFANGLIDTCEDGIKCRVHFQSKIIELFLLLRAYYSSEQLYNLLYPLLSPDVAFSEYVRMHWFKHGNVSKLAEAMNMTAQQFTKRFSSVFGQPPYKWMQQEKARLIYREICQNKKPLKEIAWDYGFTAYTHFSRFCRTAYNMNPAEIRK